MTDQEIIQELIARTRGDSLCAVRCEEYILHCFGIHQSLPVSIAHFLDAWADSGYYCVVIQN